MAEEHDNEPQNDFEKKLKELFDLIDTSGDGKIDESEFRSYMNQQNEEVQVSKQDSLRAMIELDDDTNNEIDFREFCEDKNWKLMKTCGIELFEGFVDDIIKKVKDSREAGASSIF